MTESNAFVDTCVVRVPDKYRKVNTVILEINGWLHEYIGRDHFEMLYKTYIPSDGQWHSMEAKELWYVAFDSEESAMAFKLVWGV